MGMRLALVAGIVGAVTTVAVAQQTAGLLPDLLSDVQRLEADDHRARFMALTSMLEERNVPFELEPFTIEQRGNETRTEGQNIVVTIPAGGPAPPGPAGDIVIGAHYDAIRLPDGSLSRGAVDNGASSVLLVRMAEALLAEPLNRRVWLVWFDMEELGLAGSARWVADHAGDRIAAAVILDINAFGDTVLYGPGGSAPSGWVRRTLRQACGAQNRACVEFAAMPRSDDHSFEAVDIPNVSIAIVPRLQVHQLWLMLNGGSDSGLAVGFVPDILRTIHTPNDSSDLVDPAAMTRVYELILAFVREL